MTKNSWGAYNYCISFIDLLGQWEEYKNQGLLPQFASGEEREAFLQQIKCSIGVIFDLQKTAENMLKAALSPTSQLKKSCLLSYTTAMTRCKKLELNVRDGLMDLSLSYALAIHISNVP